MSSPAPRVSRNPWPPPLWLGTNILLLVRTKFGQVQEVAEHDHWPSRHVHTVKEACRMLDAASSPCPKAKAAASPLLHIGLSASSRIDVAFAASLNSMAAAVGSRSRGTRFAAGENASRGSTNVRCVAWTMQLVVKPAGTLPLDFAKPLEVSAGTSISSSFQRVRPSRARCLVPPLVSLEPLRVLYIPPRGSWRAGA